MRALIRNTLAYRVLSLVKGCFPWAKSRFAAPSPHFIKQACLLRNGIPAATWVETGTYVGATTHLLSKYATKVYSIEPEPTLFARAAKHFRNFRNVEILHGTSESIFPDLLPRIHGNVNFWLDGHYSGGQTFKGAQVTPIVDELRNIALNRHHFKDVCVLVDDIRCFNPRLSEYAAYPPIDVLVDWARANNLQWHIEHDIFIARG